METPSPIPGAKPPLGRAFYRRLFAPVVCMAVAAAASAVGTRNSGLESFGMIVSLLSLLAMIACSVVCAVMVGRRKGGGLGLLTFLGIQVVYVAVAFAGCAVTVGKMNFR